MTDPVVEVVADPGCKLGESPLWHDVERALYFVDVPPGRLLRFDPAHGQVEEWHVGHEPIALTIQQDGSLLIFFARGAVGVFREGRVTDVIAGPGGRFNDVCATVDGGVLCGMIAADGGGRVCVLDRYGSLSQVADGVAMPNGIAFEPDGARVYITDTTNRTILTGEYSTRSSTLQPLRTHVNTASIPGLPDGLARDADGNLWSARYGAGRVVCIDPSGAMSASIAVPARRVTSIAFGGVDLRDLYVTSSSAGERARCGTGSGTLLRLRPGPSGSPGFCSRVELAAGRRE